MEASSSTFRAPRYVNQWVRQGLCSIESVGEIDINQSPSIFRLPKQITQTKPEAYTPHLLGLGPYNHFRHQFHVTDRLKRAIVKEFISKNSSYRFSRDFVGKMKKKLEMAVRSSYGEYLDLTESTLAYIMAIDSFFLLYYLRTTTGRDDKFIITLLHNEFSKDVLMLENQIPAEPLAQMGKELGVLPNDTKLYALFYDFCTDHSPLTLSKKPEHQINKSTHLLAHMYNLIVCNRVVKGTLFYDAEEEPPTHQMVFADDLRPLFTAAFQMLTPIVQQTFKRTLFGRLVNVFTKVIVNLPHFISKKQTQSGYQIPSVSTLSEKLKVEFKPTVGGIRDIKFQKDDGEETKKKGRTRRRSTLYLPEITLEYGSEEVLRNLVAYEAAIATPESKLELNHYVDLMCSIIATAKDVQLLRDKDIIIIRDEYSRRLRDEEVAKMFSGISSCVGGGGKSTETTESLIAMAEVNEMVEKWENKKLWERVCRFCSENVVVNTVIRVVFSYAVVQVLLEMVNNYCQLYGCSKKVYQITSIVRWVSILVSTLVKRF